MATWITIPNRHSRYGGTRCMWKSFWMYYNSAHAFSMPTTQLFRTIVDRCAFSRCAPSRFAQSANGELCMFVFGSQNTNTHVCTRAHNTIEELSNCEYGFYVDLHRRSMGPFPSKWKRNFQTVLLSMWPRAEIQTKLSKKKFVDCLFSEF